MNEEGSGYPNMTFGQEEDENNRYSLRNSLKTDACHFMGKYTRFLLKKHVDFPDGPREENVKFSKNQFDVSDADSGTNIIFVGEEEEGELGGLSLHVYDSRNKLNRLAFTVYRQENPSCPIGCYSRNMDIFSSEGVTLGEIKQKVGEGLCFRSSFHISLEESEEEFKVNGPLCCLGGSSDTYTLIDVNKNQQIGKMARVTKKSMSRYSVLSPGFLLELDSWHDGESVVHFLGALLYLEANYYIERDISKEDASCCPTFICFGSSLLCSVDKLFASKKSQKLPLTKHYISEE